MNHFKLLSDHISNLERNDEEEFAELVYYIYTGNFLQLFEMLQHRVYSCVINNKPYSNWHGNIGFSVIQSFNQRIIHNFHGCLENSKDCNMLELIFLFKSFGLNIYEPNYYGNTIFEDLIQEEYTDKKCLKLIHYHCPFYKKPIQNGDVIFEFTSNTFKPEYEQPGVPVEHDFFTRLRYEVFDEENYNSCFENDLEDFEQGQFF